MIKSAAFILACLGAGLRAQVQVKGRFQETILQLYYQKHDMDVPVIRPAERVDNTLAMTEELFNAAAHTKPYKFAESVHIDVDIARDGAWNDFVAIDGTPLKIWQAVVASDNAVSLSLQFAEFRLPATAEFYIHGREDFIGAFTGAVNNKDDGHFATVPISGDFLALIVVMPSEGTESTKLAQEQLRFKIGHMAHGFRGFPKVFRSSGSCNIDVACEPGEKYAEQIRAVAMIITRDGTRFCSGTMVNNAALDGRQLFLTANHCMITSPANMVAVFNYQMKQCNQVNPWPPSSTQSAHGMRMVAQWASSDFALLEITEKIPASYSVYLAGWSLSREAPKASLASTILLGTSKRLPSTTARASTRPGCTLASTTGRCPHGPVGPLSPAAPALAFSTTRDSWSASCTAAQPAAGISSAMTLTAPWPTAGPAATPRQADSATT